MALLVAPMALPTADNNNGRQFTKHHVVDTHVRGNDLSVVYTNELVSGERSIQTIEQLLDEDKYQMVGFHLELASGRAGQYRKVVVTQLCVRHDLATRPCERVATFIHNPNYSFTTVDTTNDLKVLDVSGLTYQNLVNIHDHYKDESKKDKNTRHSAWDQRLDEEHVKYAAKDAYTSYEMYMQIVDIRKCLRPALDEGSSHREVAGASQEVHD
ncbi:hypothetical protein D1007_04035 [Hordeum vulgare]|nr:hypothetical protein D1007_04035 [Hordeum vulgare]